MKFKPSLPALLFFSFSYLRGAFIFLRSRTYVVATANQFQLKIAFSAALISIAAAPRFELTPLQPPRSAGSLHLASFGLLQCLRAGPLVEARRADLCLPRCPRPVFLWVESCLTVEKHMQRRQEGNEGAWRRNEM